MKTTALIPGNFDEIVFSGRNQDYGAYSIRQHYPASLNRSFSISTAFLLLAVAIPFISNYYHKQQLLDETRYVTAELSKLSTPTAPPPPLPPPPDDRLLEKKTRFVAPIITDADSADDGTALNQEDLNKLAVNKPIDTAEFTSGGTEQHRVIEEQKRPEPFTVVEEMPEFPGGDEARLDFLRKNLIYPELAKASGIFGTVYVEFVVEETGKVTSLNIKKGIGGGCDEEALRVVSMMHWKPGRQAGQNVPVRFTIPIRFVLKG